MGTGYCTVFVYSGCQLVCIGDEMVFEMQEQLYSISEHIVHDFFRAWNWLHRLHLKVNDHQILRNCLPPEKYFDQP